jgi:predicted CXXCH cytochrome family protein
MHNKKNIHLIILILLFCLLQLSLSSQASILTVHGDKHKLPKGCGSCHRGHGIFNTPMLPEKKDTFCFRCHGNSVNVVRAKNNGDLSKETKMINLQREFEKPYHHPIEKAENFMSRGVKKTFPEVDPSMPRNVQCVDCHNHHYVTKENKMVGIKGLSSLGEKVDSINHEYELCFKCHSYSANLPPDQINKAELFKVSNPSFHPVIAPGRNDNVTSLIHSLTPQSTIKCTDCHNNDAPTGPKGPHGSLYRHMLRKNFSATDGSESPSQYELCYSCHRRNSILGNESFSFHKLHISTIGTSCRTCHNPHGSYTFAHLIDFDGNPSVIFPSSSGALQFRAIGIKTGECFLNCHGKDHNPATYPNVTSAPLTNKSRYPKR